MTETKKHDTRFPDMGIQSVETMSEHQSLEITCPQPGPCCSGRFDSRAQLIRITSQDKVCMGIGEGHDRNHHEGFLCLCGIIDDDVTEMSDRYIQVLEDGHLGAGREHDTEGKQSLMPWNS